MSGNTVAYHIRHVLARLDMHDRAQMVAGLWGRSESRDSYPRRQGGGASPCILTGEGGDGRSAGRQGNRMKPMHAAAGGCCARVLR